MVISPLGYAIFLFAIIIIDIFAIKNHCITNTLEKSIVPHLKQRGDNLEVQGINFVKDNCFVLVRSGALGWNSLGNIAD